MDELGVDLSVVFTYEGLLRPSAAANDSLAAWVAPAPDRLVAFATVDPRDPGASGGDRALRPRARRCAASSSIPGCRASRRTSRVCSASARRRARSGSRSSSTTARRRSRPRSSSRCSRAGIRGRQIVLGHGGLHDLWREAIAAVLTTPNVHLCMSRDARLRDAGDRRALPARAAALRHGRRPAPRAAAALRRAARAPARRAGPRRGAARGDPRSRTRAACSPHDRRPLPRADAPRRASRPTSSSSTTSGAPTGPWRRRRPGPTTPRRSRTWRSRSRSRSPATGRGSTPALNDAVADLRRRRAGPPDRLPLRPPGGGRRAGRARAGARRSGAEGDQARPELPGLRPARRRRAAPLRGRRAPRSAGALPPGRLARPGGAAPLRASAADGRDRDPLPRASGRDGAHGPPLAAGDDRDDPQAPARVRRRLGALLPAVELLRGPAARDRVGRARQAPLRLRLPDRDARRRPRRGCGGSTTRSRGRSCRRSRSTRSRS